MEKREQFIEDEQALDQVLGYLNFSSGNADPKFLSNLNRLWPASTGTSNTSPAWKRFGETLRSRLASVAGSTGPFQDATQATSVLGLLHDHVIDRYLQFHQDLLFHQTPDTIVN